MAAASRQYINSFKIKSIYYSAVQNNFVKLFLIYTNFTAVPVAITTMALPWHMFVRE